MSLSENNMRRWAVAAAAALALLCTPVMRAQFVDHSPARQFIEVDVHALAGTSGITQNYGSSFGAITNLNTSMGASFGAGAGAVFGMREWFGLGTEINLVYASNKLDMAVSGSESPSVSNVFIRNRFFYSNFPVFMSFRFNIVPGVRWRVDTGFYYTFGLLGKQKQSIYNTTINELGQLVPRIVITEPDYYHDSNTFINSYNRGDIGLHLATSLQFGNHLIVGVRSQIGFKNQSYTRGIKNPNIHNVNILATLGYRL